MKTIFIPTRKEKTDEDILIELAVAVLKTGAADYVLTTGKEKTAWAMFPHLFSSAENIEADAFPLEPVMLISSASALKDIAAEKTGARILAILRPCEARAAVELAKMNQITRDNVCLAVFDCMGTVSGEEYRKKAGENPSRELLVDTLKALSDCSLLERCRESCLVCQHHGADDLDVDIILGLAGISGQGLLISAKSEMGAKIIEGVEKEMGVGPADDEDSKADDLSGRRLKALSDLEVAISPRREKIENNHKKNMTGWEALAQTLKDCVGCHACMRVCPVCFCRTCFFESKQVRTSLDYNLRSADARGAMALPTDKLFFHLGRMTHMSLSCVGCGLCEDTCRAGVPVAALFRQASFAATSVFSYQAGRRLDEKHPFSTFEHEELQNVVRRYEPLEE